jgi:hypothetical protein
MTIQVIETRYKGYRFRSRLEARWAVFFDTLGAHWVYEPEGFDLAESGWYLPDFWIEDWESYVEIKPVRDLSPQEKSDEDRKFRALNLQTQHMVILLEGSPYPDEYEATRYHLQQSPGGWLGETDLFSHVSRELEFQAWFTDDDTNNLDPRELSLRPANYYSADLGVIGRDGSIREEIMADAYSARPPALMKAYAAARSARFEHGESG